MKQSNKSLGIDFGTSNSAVGYFGENGPQLIKMQSGDYTIPTTFFFDYHSRNILIGSAANRALFDGNEGRFMRALKRVLGTPLMYEKQQLLNQKLNFVDIISYFLKHIKTEAEKHTGFIFDRALSGRPVYFHGRGDPREAQAEIDLRKCYIAAGFKEVDFLPEPQAAAIASDMSGNVRDQLGLIVDIGGGTSDFSVFHKNKNGNVSILANHGLRIGGTDFDRSVSLEHVMPLLGRGSNLRREMGAGQIETPVGLYSDLATWEKIPFVYTARNRRIVSEMQQLATQPEKLRRLATVLEYELGHDLAFCVEKGKIDVNSAKDAPKIDLNLIEPDLLVSLSSHNFAKCLNIYATHLADGGKEVLELAGIKSENIDTVIYVGGSSLMAFVSDLFKADFPNANHTYSEVFTAVVSGLTIASEH